MEIMRVVGSVQRVRRTLLTVAAAVPMAVSAAVLIAVSTITSSAMAVEYSLDGNIGLLSRASDNVRLSLDSKEDFHGVLLTPSATLLRRSERSRLSSAVHLQSSHYNLSGYSTFDQRLAVDYSRQSERAQWRVGASADRDSTREAELTGAGAGVFETVASRVNYSNGYFSWVGSLDARQSLTWRSDINTARYDSERFSDYDYGNTSLLWQYALNDRLQLQASTAYAQLRSDNQNISISPLFGAVLDEGAAISAVLNEIDRCQLDESSQATFDIAMGAVAFPCFERVASDNRQQTVRGQLGLYYQLTPRLTADILLGRTRVGTKMSASYPDLPEEIGVDTSVEVNYAGNMLDRSNSGTTYSASLNYDDEAFLYRLSASASNEANSSGMLVLNTRVVFDTNWRLDERRSLLFDISWLEQRLSSEQNDLVNGRELFGLRGRYHHRLDANWSVTGGYRFYDQRRSGRSEHARSNEVSLTVSWRPTTLKWSR